MEPRMTPDKARLFLLEHKMKARVKGFEVRYPKDKYALMRFLNFFVRVFNKDFMTGYITTIGRKIYWPSEPDADAFDTQAHECQHVWDWKRLPILYDIGYLSPQIWCLLSLGAFAVFANIWALFCLLTLPFVAPLPGYFRMRIEMRGYAMTMAVTHWRSGTWPDMEWLGSKFWGMDYFWMWPFKNNVRKRLQKIQAAILDGSILNWSPVFQDVHDICKMDDATVVQTARELGGK